MRRRDFIKVIACSAIAWPVTARAQETRHIGVLMNRAPEHPEGQPAIAAFRQALQQLGWTEGRNIRIDIRWGENDVDRDRKYAADLVALAPDVILAAGTLSVTAFGIHRKIIQCELRAEGIGALDVARRSKN
jgi:putative tryptophan/tyrosine transport system substrate-binding protein